MSFASPTFLFVFLPLFLAVYYSALAARVDIRGLNLIALVFSVAFYVWGAPRFVPILLVSCFADYVLSRRISSLPRDNRFRGTLLLLSIFLNVGCLLYFKYTNFFVAQVDDLLSQAGIEPLQWTTVVLPIGISFITFEKLSYIIDVYRDRTVPAPSFVTYLLFITLFPHLIAGPIFRYHDLADQLLYRKHGLERATSGILRFALGLAKKVLIADALAPIADTIFSMPHNELTPGRTWLGILAYAYQIYFDFSGYSDMAIGLGRLLGFEFMENFNQPYISQSITEFWRRWHISLSSWLREYLYLPLGGNRISTRRTYFNLWIVFLISGFWHGANWTFLIWGCYHGLFLMLDRLFLLKVLGKLPLLIRTGVTFLIVLCGWVLFRAESLPQALAYLGHMFVPSGSQPSPSIPLLTQLNNRTYLAFLAATAISFCPAFRGFAVTFREHMSPSSGRFQFAFCSLAAICLLILSAASLVSSSFHPFIYFRF